MRAANEPPRPEPKQRVTHKRFFGPVIVHLVDPERGCAVVSNPGANILPLAAHLGALTVRLSWA